MRGPQLSRLWSKLSSFGNCDRRRANPADKRPYPFEPLDPTVNSGNTFPQVARVNIPARAALYLLDDPCESLAALRGVSTEVELVDAKDEHLVAVDRLCYEVRSLQGMGRTRTSKLAARKRPKVVPVQDTITLTALTMTAARQPNRHVSGQHYRRWLLNRQKRYGDKIISDELFLPHHASLHSDSSSKRLRV